MELLEPDQLTDACHLLADDPDATMPIAGGTAFVLLLQHGFVEPDRLVSLRGVAALRGLGRRGAVLHLGAPWKLRHGDLKAGLAAADVVHSGVYTSPSASHVPMEPHVAVASWDDERLTVWSSTQAPHAAATAMRTMFDLPEDGVRIRTRNLGGGYGAKGQIKLEPLVACAARAVGRPVRLELTRDEVYLTIAKHAATVTITTGATADGILTARKVDIVYDAGAYAVTTPGAVGQGLTRAPGPYRLPACHIDAVGRYTSRVPTGPFRGAMTSQLAFAYETQMDAIAAELGIDPVEIRRRNLLRDGDEYATGEALHDLHFDQLLTDVVAGADPDRPSEATPPHLARGKGVAVIIKNTLTPSRSEARLEACADGRLLLHSSTAEMGQGRTTTMRQIAAHHLGVAPDRVEVGFPDTAITPFDTVTASSRSTSSMGVAVERAAAALRDALAAAAADRFGVPGDAVHHVDGTVVVTADPERSVTYADLAAGPEARSTPRGCSRPTSGCSSWIPTTSADLSARTGTRVPPAPRSRSISRSATSRSSRSAAAASSGGSSARCACTSRTRGARCGGSGRRSSRSSPTSTAASATPTSASTRCPRSWTVRLTSDAVESTDPDAELHGVGEMVVPAIAPAILNAIRAATGATITDLPATPERVLRALDELWEDRP